MLVCTNFFDDEYMVRSCLTVCREHKVWDAVPGAKVAVAVCREVA
jgi:hypothetical protein